MYGRPRLDSVLNYRDRGRENGTCPKAGAVNDLSLVEVLNAYPHTFPQVKALRSDLENHAKPATKSRSAVQVRNLLCGRNRVRSASAWTRRTVSG